MKQCVALLNDGWADWEAGHVLAVLREYLGVSVRIATPRGEPAESIGGIRAASDLAFAAVSSNDADVILVIGSDQWSRRDHPEVVELLRTSVAAGKIVGTICLANVVAARAGILDARAHTANSLADLTTHAPSYKGMPHYRDLKSAVADRNVVTAPGDAPNTFAAEIMKLVDPQKGSKLASQYLRMVSAEHREPA